MANNDEILTAEAYSSEYQRILEVLKEAVKGDSAEKWKSECKRVKKEFTNLHKRRPLTGENSLNPKNPAQYPYNPPLLFLRYLTAKSGFDSKAAVLEILGELEKLSDIEIAALVLKEKSLAEVREQRKQSANLPSLPPVPKPRAAEKDVETPVHVGDIPAATPRLKRTTDGASKEDGAGKKDGPPASRGPVGYTPGHPRPMSKSKPIDKTTSAPKNASAAVKAQPRPPARFSGTLTTEELRTKYGILGEKTPGVDASQTKATHASTSTKPTPTASASKAAMPIAATSSKVTFASNTRPANGSARPKSRQKQQIEFVAPPQQSRDAKGKGRAERMDVDSDGEPEIEGGEDEEEDELEEDEQEAEILKIKQEIVETSLAALKTAEEPRRSRRFEGQEPRKRGYKSAQFVQSDSEDEEYEPSQEPDVEVISRPADADLIALVDDKRHRPTGERYVPKCTRCQKRDLPCLKLVGPNIYACFYCQKTKVQCSQAGPARRKARAEKDAAQRERRSRAPSKRRDSSKPPPTRRTKASPKPTKRKSATLTDASSVHYEGRIRQLEKEIANLKNDRDELARQRLEERRRAKTEWKALVDTLESSNLQTRLSFAESAALMRLEMRQLEEKVWIAQLGGVGAAPLMPGRWFLGEKPNRDAVPMTPDILQRAFEGAPPTSASLTPNVQPEATSMSGGPPPATVSGLPSASALPPAVEPIISTAAAVPAVLSTLTANAPSSSDATAAAVPADLPTLTAMAPSSSDDGVPHCTPTLTGSVPAIPRPSTEPPNSVIVDQPIPSAPAPAAVVDLPPAGESTSQGHVSVTVTATNAMEVSVPTPSSPLNLQPSTALEAGTPATIGLPLPMDVETAQVEVHTTEQPPIDTSKPVHSTGDTPFVDLLTATANTQDPPPRLSEKRSSVLLPPAEITAPLPTLPTTHAEPSSPLSPIPEEDSLTMSESSQQPTASMVTEDPCKVPRREVVGDDVQRRRGPRSIQATPTGPRSAPASRSGSAPATPQTRKRKATPLPPSRESKRVRGMTPDHPRGM